MLTRWLFSDAPSVSVSTSTVLVLLLGRGRRMAMATTMMIMMTRAPQLSPMTAEKVAREWDFLNTASSFSDTSSGSSSSSIFLAANAPAVKPEQDRSAKQFCSPFCSSSASRRVSYVHCDHPSILCSRCHHLDRCFPNHFYYIFKTR